MSDRTTRTLVTSALLLSVVSLTMSLAVAIVCASNAQQRQLNELKQQLQQLKKGNR